MSEHSKESEPTLREGIERLVNENNYLYIEPLEGYLELYYECRSCLMPVKKEDAQVHGCIRKLGMELLVHKFSIHKLQREVNRLTHLFTQEVDELRQQINSLQAQHRGQVNVTEDLQQQVDDIMNQLGALKLSEKAASRNSSQKSAPEEGEASDSSSSSSKAPVKGPVTPKEDDWKQLPRIPKIKIKQYEIVKSGTSNQDTPVPNCSTKRTMDERSPQNSQETKELRFTSNNAYTESRMPNGRIKLVVERAVGEPLLFEVRRETSCKELHDLIKAYMGIPKGDSISLMRPQHTVVPNDANRNLWQIGCRYIQNHLVILPDDVSQGDQLRLVYKGKGPNVNGGYKPLTTKRS